MSKTRFEYRVARLRAERRNRGKRRAKTAPCWYCGERFAVNPRGRVRRYCCRSHRQRDYEQRRLRKLRSAGIPLTLIRNDLKSALDKQAELKALVRAVVLEELRKLPGLAMPPSLITPPKPPPYGN